MPCYDSRNEPESVRREALEEYRYNSPVAEMLCAVLRRMSPTALKGLLDDVQQWWTEHKERDAKRKAGNE